ncbi:MAG: transposase [Dysgonamonadaceae bacterium]
MGKLYRAIPFTSLAESLGLKETKKGRESYFSAEGKLALMFLKSYTRFSDAELIENMNSNIHYQLFCGIRVNPRQPLTNFKIVSAIRCEVAGLLEFDKLQEVLASYWKPYMSNLQIHMTDATCNESDIRYLTDMKLLWEDVSWLYPHTYRIYKALGLRKPRSKYDKQARRYLSYSKKRKRRQTETQVLKRNLLHLLGKLIGLTDTVLKSNSSKLCLSSRFHKRYSIIRKVHHQQQLRFEGKIVKEVIVSIDKSYIHPIVRGKETKSVEFGAKVNTLQVDGINFIEHLSFSAFHEGIRLPQCVAKQQKLFRRKVSLLAVDSLYATNANRTFCHKRGIVTGFICKGRACKDKEQLKAMRSILSKYR